MRGAAPGASIIDQGIVVSSSGMEVYRSSAIPNHKRPTGRPALYNEDLAAQILYSLSNGESLIDICSKLGIAFSSVMEWTVDNHRGFTDKYVRARLSGCYYMNEMCLQIADDSRNDWMESNDPENPGWKFNGDNYQRTRLRIDQRRWFLSKMAPKIFGDKLDLTVRPETQAAPPIDLDKLTPEQLDLIEQGTRLLAQAGVKVQVVGHEMPERSIVSL